ncbi:MAG: CRISPR-associated helicase Cas3', partial [Merismopedia sp. SIO2A8]|nr:CRISPR-associated helicase Cas3' [Merismopedia sp. SIO2A8]
HYQEEPDWDRVQQELAAKGKVLWVCNQVNTAIAIYQHAKEHLGLNALLYHSRFRYGDRVKHHRAVVDGFKNNDPILAVTTQVAEMSLDLSATLLVTQIADPAGLVQRLGRLNRQYCGHALDAIFYAEDPKMVGFPYSQEDLDAGAAMVQSFSGEVNQAQLAHWLEQLDVISKPRDHFVWLDGEWRTYPASLREEGYTVTALLEQDLSIVATLKASELPKYTVPLPSRNIKDWPRHKKGYLIAPKTQWGYCSRKGAYELKEGTAV